MSYFVHTSTPAGRTDKASKKVTQEERKTGNRKREKENREEKEREREGGRTGEKGRGNTEDREGRKGRERARWQGGNEREGSEPDGGG